MKNHSHSRSRDRTPHASELPAADFAALGVDAVAFVKPVVINGAHAYAIHAADGQHLVTVPNRAVALATVRQNDLEPASVH